MPRVKRGVTARARHKKLLKKRKVIMVRIAAYIDLQSKLSLKQGSMLILVAN